MSADNLKKSEKRFVKGMTALEYQRIYFQNNKNKIYQRRKKDVHCQECNKSYSYESIARHNKSKIHLLNKELYNTNHSQDSIPAQS